MNVVRHRVSSPKYQINFFSCILRPLFKSFHLFDRSYKRDIASELPIFPCFVFIILRHSILSLTANLPSTLSSCTFLIIEVYVPVCYLHDIVSLRYLIILFTHQLVYLVNEVISSYLLWLIRKNTVSIILYLCGLINRHLAYWEDIMTYKVFV